MAIGIGFARDEYDEKSIEDYYEEELNDANYYEWNKLNWLGVIVFTLLLNCVFAPFALFYWAIKILVFTFTVGRR